MDDDDFRKELEETEIAQEKAQTAKNSQLKEDIINVCKTESGMRFLTHIRWLGGAGFVPVIPGDHIQSHYLVGRFSLMNEITETIKAADFDSYINLLLYEEEQKQNN